jgi:hypothetical protein
VRSVGGPAPKPGTIRHRNTEGCIAVATYRMVYGDDDQVVTETFENVDEVEREDGWVVLFRGSDAILRVQEEHVKAMELLS